MPIVHLPVQSGSNNILRSMNRKHDVEHYIELINKLKKVNSRIKFSSDFIIGYPGEKDKDFEDTLKLLRKVKFINTFSFIFSPRPGTPASQKEKVRYETAKERLIIFQKVADEIKMKYRENLINKNSLVLFENNVGNKKEFFGKDEFSNSVIVRSEDSLKGKIKNVKILNTNRSTLFGQINNEVVEKKEFVA